MQLLIDTEQVVAPRFGFGTPQWDLTVGRFGQDGFKVEF